MRSTVSEDKEVTTDRNNSIVHKYAALKEMENILTAAIKRFYKGSSFKNKLSYLFCYPDVGSHYKVSEKRFNDLLPGERNALQRLDQKAQVNVNRQIPLEHLLTHITHIIKNILETLYPTIENEYLQYQGGLSGMYTFLMAKKDGNKSAATDFLKAELFDPHLLTEIFSFNK